MLFTTKSLANWFPNVRGNIGDHVQIEKVNTDSRLEVENSLFIPIVGENFDGHAYVNQAIERGAVAVFWDNDKELPSHIANDFPVYFVNDTLKALQTLAGHYRDEINPTVIGITGSNGKTTTKDLVASMVRSTFVTHYTNGNFNNHIGLPLTILSMTRGTEILVLEMGMSGFGEIDLLSKIAKPDYAIITNIGESHIEFLGSREGIAKAKLEIVNGLKNHGKVIIDGDETLLQSLHKSQNTITCGFSSRNDYQIENVEVTSEKTVFHLSDSETYEIPLLGKHHAKNASYAVALGDCLGIESKKRTKALHEVKHTAMRFELLKGKKGVSIINDAYNASPTSMKAAIEVVKEMNGFSQKVLVLGDVLELGEHKESLHRSVAETIESPITVLFTFGDYAHVISESVKDKSSDIITQHFHSKEDMLSGLQAYLNGESLILFKASRGLKLESVIKELMN